MNTTPLDEKDREAIRGMPGRWFRLAGNLVRVRYQRRRPGGWIATTYERRERSAPAFSVVRGADGLPKEMRWNGPDPPKWVELGDGHSVLGSYPTPDGAVEAAADALKIMENDERLCTTRELVQVKRDRKAGLLP